MNPSTSNLLIELLADQEVRPSLESWCSDLRLDVADEASYNRLDKEILGNDVDAKRFLAALANEQFGRGKFAQCLQFYILSSRKKGSYLLPVGTIRQLGERFFAEDDLENCIRSFELLSVLQPSIRTPRIILASLYFRQAVTLLAQSSYNEAFSLIAKSYSYRSETFELLRIYITKSDIYQHLHRPVRVGDVSEFAASLCQQCEDYFLANTYRTHPIFYRFFRSLLQFTGQQAKLVLFERLWLVDALAEAEDNLKSGNLDRAHNLCTFAIDLHPKIVLTESLSPFYSILASVLEERGQLSEAQANAKLAISCNSSNYLYRPADVVRAATSSVKDNVIILTYVSSMYFPIFEVWYSHALRHSLSNVLVIATDPVVYKKLLDRQINCLFEPLFAYQSDFIYGTDFCASRVRVLNEVIRSGFDLLLCGVDSIFLKDPIPLVKSFDCDIVAMGLTSQISNWFYNVNADFFFLRSSSGTKQLLVKQLELQARLLSDQLAINQALAEYGINWQVYDGGEVIGTCDRPSLRAYLLPPSISCRRIEDLRESTIIYQPAGGFKGKVAALKQLNLSS